MKIDEVPQDKGMIAEYGTEICYAVNEKGKYTLASSLGWEPKNIVNSQAWEIIDDDICNALKKVEQKVLSPIAFYQAKHQMDVTLLSQYAGMAKWRVKRHLKPRIFKKLSNKILLKYCAIFDITIDELKQIPKKYLP